MKKFFLLTLPLAVACTVQAQRTRLNLYSGYVFNDGYDYYVDADNYYNGTVKGGYQWGGGIEFFPRPNYSFELMYLRHSTHSPTNFKGGSGTPAKSEDFELDLNYIMASGFGHLVSVAGRAEGYAGLMLGVVSGNVKAPSTGGSASRTSFAWGARLGTNLWVTRKVGIKLQTQLLVATRATGGQYYFGFYGPVYAPSYTTVYQYGLGGGLTFKLGK